MKCSKIHYQNPRIVVGCIPVKNEQVLLCRRGIAPQKDKWTIPAGFMENFETVEEGALRETMEETQLDVQIRRLQSVYSIPDIGQVYILFVADVDKNEAQITEECLEVRWFSEGQLPWENIAFTAVRFALKKYFEDLQTGSKEVHFGTYDKKEIYE
jgi:ADP-ribose pyrophosphatase YjhB (NUDIX family)